jgi:hypothetical protein
LSHSVKLSSFGTAGKRLLKNYQKFELIKIDYVSHLNPDRGKPFFRMTAHVDKEISVPARFCQQKNGMDFDLETVGPLFELV